MSDTHENRFNRRKPHRSMAETQSYTAFLEFSVKQQKQNSDEEKGNENEINREKVKRTKNSYRVKKV